MYGALIDPLHTTPSGRATPLAPRDQRRNPRRFSRPAQPKQASFIDFSNLPAPLSHPLIFLWRAPLHLSLPRSPSPHIKMADEDELVDYDEDEQQQEGEEKGDDGKEVKK